MSLNSDVLSRSFELIIDREPELARRFYDRFFQRYPSVRSMFTRKTRDRQEQMLQQALVSVLDHVDDAPWLEHQLTALGAKHVEYGVMPHMYDWVGECLLATLAEIAGPDWTLQTRQAWADAYAAIAALMRAGAEASIGSPIEYAVRASVEGR